jgi:hypothetical protein
MIRTHCAFQVGHTVQGDPVNLSRDVDANLSQDPFVRRGTLHKQSVHWNKPHTTGTIRSWGLPLLFI